VRKYAKSLESMLKVEKVEKSRKYAKRWESMLKVEKVEKSEKVY